MTGRQGVLIVALLLACRPLGAHDLERTGVTITLARDRSFVMDVSNDPNWLLLRLEPFAGGLVPAGLTPEQRDRRLSELAPVFADRVVLFVDGHEVRAASTEYLPPSASSASSAALSGLAPPALVGVGDSVAFRGSLGSLESGLRPFWEFRSASSVSSAALIDQGELAVYRLRGILPPGASTLRWFYGIVVDPYPLTVVRAGGATSTEWIAGTVWSSSIDLAGEAVRQTRGQIARQYLVLGYTHILPKGLDHILFVLGIFLLSPRVKTMVLQVSAFTVAHSITLALSIYGMMSIPSRVVEPLIALSIAYVAIENLVTRELKPWRLALVFGFGLLHGLGFAGVLRGLGLPREEFLTGLITFNLGVEGGQLTVIALAAIVVAPLVRQGWYRQRVVIPASCVTAAIGLYWTIARL